MNVTQDELAAMLKRNDELAVIDEPPVNAPAPVSAQPRANKYGAQKTWSELCQRTFDSRGEARHGEWLKARELAGQIEKLQFQIRFTLSEKPRISVTLDFGYVEDGKLVYEDFKGVLTRDSRTKYVWLREQQGIEVRIVRGEGTYGG